MKTHETGREGYTESDKNEEKDNDLMTVASKRTKVAKLRKRAIYYISSAFWSSTVHHVSVTGKLTKKEIIFNETK